MSVCVWDVETTITNRYKKKANPFIPENWVVASGYKKDGMAKNAADYFTERPKGDWFTKLLDGTKLLVGFNIKFDLHHALVDPDNYKAWMKWVADGGRIWDCQLAEYLLDGQDEQSFYLKLDEVAPRYGGHLKDDAVKALWDAGVNTPDIDKNLLLEYLIGADGGEKDKGDIGNTDLVFRGQLAAARKRGQLQSILLNMDSLICTVEMELNGMRVDKERGLVLAQELAERLRVLTLGLEGFLPKDMPPELEFNWGSRWHLSPLVFGGKVKYKKRMPILNEKGELTYKQKKEAHYVLTDGTTTPDKPTAETVMKYATYASGKNAGEYKTKQVTMPDMSEGPKMRWEELYFQFPGYTVGPDEWKSKNFDSDGLYSVKSDNIKELSETSDIPFLKQLGEVAKLQKDLGTYYITTDEETGEQTGMLTLVGDDGIIHHSLNHTSTVTGRFSSSNPNLQNIPKGDKSDVKSLFISRFENGFIVQSDFTSLEIYIQAVLTKCRQLIEDLKLGLDMHCQRLAQKLGEPYEDVLKKCKDENHPDYPRYHKMRTGSKGFSFQRAYGAGVDKIAKSTGMSVEDVQALVEAEHERYPEVDEYYEWLTEQIKKNRRPTNNMVPHPQVRGLMCQLGRSHFVAPDGKKYTYKESPSPEWIAKKPVNKGGTAQSFSPPEIKNYIVQGEGGEWAKAAMSLAIRSYYKHGNFGMLALLVNQVHDALYQDCDASVLVQSSAMLHACMEEASAYMEYLFKWEVPVAVPSETKHGRSMLEERDLPPEFKPQVEVSRKWVRDTFMPGFTATYEKAA